MTTSIRSLVPAALTLPLVLAGGPVRATDVRTEFGVYEYVLEHAGARVFVVRESGQTPQQAGR